MPAGIVEFMTQHLLCSAFSARSGSVMGEETLQAGLWNKLQLGYGFMKDISTQCMSTMHSFGTVVETKNRLHLTG